jgi:DNA-binding CsgD family transcriptional regulator
MGGIAGVREAVSHPLTDSLPRTLTRADPLTQVHTLTQAQSATRSWPLTGPSPRPLMRSLIGRDEELGLISGFIGRAASAGGAMLLIGDLGAGKTALLGVAAERATACGIRVLRGSGAEFETGLPFASLHQVLVPLADEIERLAEPHRAALLVAMGFVGGLVPDPLLVCNAALTLIRTASKAQPLLIVVDDLHRIDPASAPVLGFLARRLAGTAAGFLGALRTGPEGLFERTGLAELELQPLDEAAASRLLSSASPPLSPRTHGRVLAEARGNPLALLELPRVLGERGPATTDGWTTVLPPDRRLQGIYAAQLAEIPQRSRDALLLLALDGTAGGRALGATRDGYPSLADLVPAEQAGLVEMTPGAQRLMFRHPLTRAAVVELSSGDERRRAHRRLAELMSDEPDRRAWHLSEAALEPDEEVAGLLERAAHTILRRGDATSAIAALTRAAELSPAAPDQVRRVAAAACLRAGLTGDLRSAEALLAGARRADPDFIAPAEAAVAAAFVLLNGDGDITAAHRLLTGAIEAADGRSLIPVTADGATLSPMGAEGAVRALVLVCHFGGRTDLWETLAPHLASFGPELPTSLRLCATLTADPAQSPEADLRCLDTEIESLPRLADPMEIVRIAGTSTFVDRLPRCRQAMRRVAREEVHGGAVTQVIYANTLLAVEAFQTGQWAEAQRLASVAADLSETRGYQLLRWNADAVRAVVAAAGGETALAQALADETIGWAAPRGVQLLRSRARYAHVLAALAQSDFEAAYHHAIKITPAGQLKSCEPHALWVMVDLVEAALRTGRAGEAAAHVRAMREAGIARISSRLALLSSAAAAMIAPDEEVTGLFDQALATRDAERWPFDMARVQLLYGERLRRTREMTQARVHLAAALETFRRLGAMTWAERAAMELRATGRTRQRGEHHDYEALTPQELEIAMLAATGLSNKQIGNRLYLSHRTVGAHLYRIFPKLGITSRAALRDALPDQPAKPVRSPARLAHQPAG